MKDLIVGILIALLVVSFIQPFVEVANVMKEKITLNAAIRNSCRAARNHSLAYDEWRDLNAEVQLGQFAQHFADAFAATLDLNQPSTVGDHMSFTSNNGRWNTIEVSLRMDYIDSGTFNERGETWVNIYVDTPYLFRNALLRWVNNSASSRYRLIEDRSFLVQVIN